MPAQERTEPATPRRYQELRRRGQAVRSAEIGSALALLAGFLVFRYLGQDMHYQMETLMRESFGSLAWRELSPANVALQGLGVGVAFLRLTAPLFLALGVVGVASNLFQTRFLLSARPLVPDLSRINPLQGLARLFSRRSLVELAKTLIKLAIVGGVVYQAYQTSYPKLVGIIDLDLQAAVGVVAEIATGLGLQAGAALLVLAALDYGYQRWDFAKRARMTREELKEELRQYEGSPELRARIRRQQRQLASRRMMQEVPKATVVIINPVHLAVALEYHPGAIPAPKLTAKGARLLAQRIKEIAREHRVPIIENPPLAWALYRGVQIGEFIPAALYQAVAEVLAFIYGLRRRPD